MVNYTIPVCYRDYGPKPERPIPMTYFHRNRLISIPNWVRTKAQKSFRMLIVSSATYIKNGYYILHTLSIASIKRNVISTDYLVISYSWIYYSDGEWVVMGSIDASVYVFDRNESLDSDTSSRVTSLFTRKLRWTLGGKSEAGTEYVDAVTVSRA